MGRSLFIVMLFGKPKNLLATYGMSQGKLLFVFILDLQFVDGDIKINGNFLFFYNFLKQSTLPRIKKIIATKSPYVFKKPDNLLALLGQKPELHL